MTQYDALGTTPNGSGADVRTGFNNNFKAIVTENEGASAPSPTYAFMTWRNHTGKIVYRRNATDTGWEVIRNYGATVDPTVSTDSSLGYVFGSEYFNVSNRKIFRCFDATTGAADWREIGLIPYLVNVKDPIYGAKGDGTTDDTTAIQAAIDVGGRVYFPPGRYKVSAKLTSSNKSLALVGAGQSITELRWNSGASTRGIEITTNDGTHYIEVTDLSLTTLASTGNALVLDFSDQVVSGNITERWQKRFSVKDVTIEGATAKDTGSPFSDGWVTGILLVCPVNGSIRDVTLIGKAATVYVGVDNSYGIEIQGDPATGNTNNGFPGNIIIDNINASFWDFAISVHNAQEITVNSGNIVACDTGVYLYSQYSRIAARIVDLHANCFSFGIYIDGMREVIVCHCELYGIQTSTAWNAVLVSATSGEVILSENIVNSFSGSAGSNGLVINGNNCVASGNVFDQQSTNITTCIWLTSTASGCKGSDNLYNGTFTNTVLNQGTGNSVT